MDNLECGFAQRKITPERPGIFLDGYGFRMTPAERVRDDLYVKVCAMRCGEKKFIMASFDLVGFSPELYRIVTDQMTAVTGIPREYISVSAIHTHAAPVGGILDQLPVNYDFIASAGERAGYAANEAFEKACAGHFSFEIIPDALKHTLNRRMRGIIDRSVRAASFTGTDGKLKGVICSAACHAVIDTQAEISADYLSVLNSVSSDEIPYMFLSGRGADINPDALGTEDMNEFINILGHELADPVVNAEKRALNTKNEPMRGELCTRYELTELPMKDYMPESVLLENIEQQQKLYFSLPDDNIEKHFALRELEWNRKQLRQLREGVKTAITVPLAELSFGKAFVFAFVPFELLTATGNRLEEYYVSKGFSRESVFTVGYSNSLNGYLAGPEEFEFGGYEVSGAAHWYGINETSPLTEPAMLNWFRRDS